MRTRAAELLGVKLPRCGFSHCRDVVAAVTHAGGFGVDLPVPPEPSHTVRSPSTTGIVEEIVDQAGRLEGPVER